MSSVTFSFNTTCSTAQTASAGETNSASDDLTVLTGVTVQDTGGSLGLLVWAMTSSSMRRAASAWVSRTRPSPSTPDAGYCAMSHRPRERAFRLGEIASGEPHLYCGHAPPLLMPCGFAVLVALCRRIHLAAKRWLSRRRREQIVIEDAGAAEQVPSRRARAGRVS